MTRALALALLGIGAFTCAASADEPDPATEDARPVAKAEHEDVDGDAANDGPAPQWGKGPLEVRDPFILALARMRPWARSPETLGHLQAEASLRITWANSWAFDRDRYLIDAETGHFDVVVRFGLLDRIELGLLLPYESRGGGVLDGFLEGFHDVFALPQGDRDNFSRDDFGVQVTEEDGTVPSIDHVTAGFADLILSGRALLSEGDASLPAVAVTGRLRLPTGRADLQLADGVDWTLQLDASKRIGNLPLVVYTSLAYTYYGDARVEGFALMRHRLFFSLGGEWEIHPTLSLAVHTWIESRRELRAFDDGPAVPEIDERVAGDWITHIAFGLKWAPFDWLQLEAGGLENIVDPDVTADLGLLVNLTVRI